jgi:phosphate/sulfate permease
MELLLAVIFVALVFEYINGFHDTANSIATVVSTKVLSPRQAILLAAVTNLVGALAGTAVAKTISSGLVDAKFVTTTTIICALSGGIIWNLVTWWFGLPSSSSHALIGGLCGATLASAQGNWSALIWAKAKDGVPWYKYDGLLYKVVIPMALSPLMGFLVGVLVMSLLYLFLRNWKPRWVSSVFGKLQLVSAGYMGFSHGSNDAQKTMGIIALALAAATTSGTLDRLPSWARFLYQPEVSPAVYAAQARLAELHFTGTGVPQNDQAAVARSSAPAPARTSPPPHAWAAITPSTVTLPQRSPRSPPAPRARTPSPRPRWPNCSAPAKPVRPTRVPPPAGPPPPPRTSR